MGTNLNLERGKVTDNYRTSEAKQGRKVDQKVSGNRIKRHEEASEIKRSVETG